MLVFLIPLMEVNLKRKLCVYPTGVPLAVIRSSVSLKRKLPVLTVPGAD
jgi:hypothetical protein